MMSLLALRLEALERMKRPILLFGYL
jgi:hypothetical protein